MQNTPILPLFTLYRVLDVISTDRIKPGHRRIILPVVRFSHEPHNLLKRKDLSESGAALAIVYISAIIAAAVACSFFRLRRERQQSISTYSESKDGFTSTRAIFSCLARISSAASCLLRGKPVNNMRFWLLYGEPHLSNFCTASGKGVNTLKTLENVITSTSLCGISFFRTFCDISIHS